MGGKGARQKIGVGGEGLKGAECSGVSVSQLESTDNVHRTTT